MLTGYDSYSATTDMHVHTVVATLQFNLSSLFYLLYAIFFSVNKNYQKF